MEQSIDGVELSAEQVEEFKDAFAEFDNNGDGHINTQELGMVMQRLGEFPTEEELKSMVAEVDQVKFDM